MQLDDTAAQNNAIDEGNQPELNQESKTTQINRTDSVKLSDADNMTTVPKQHRFADRSSLNGAANVRHIYPNDRENSDLLTFFQM